MLRVTVDSTVLEGHMRRIREATDGLGVEIRTTTVTLRERGLKTIPGEPVIAETGVWGESRWDEFVWGESPPVREALVIDETPLNMGVVVSDDSVSRFEAMLVIIGNGSFPKRGERNNLSRGQLHQLRDAMILEAHARKGRDVLISDDATGFIGPDGSKRRKLEALCKTRILKVDEFCAEVGTLASAATSPS